jgi:hypothetical protein
LTAPKYSRYVIHNWIQKIKIIHASDASSINTFTNINIYKHNININISPPSSGLKNPRARNQREQVAAICRRYFPPKRRFTQDLHGVTSQKTAFFIVTAVKTSNLTWSYRISTQIWILRKHVSNTVKLSINFWHTLFETYPTQNLSLKLKFTSWYY